MLEQYKEVELVRDLMSDCTLGEPVLLTRGQRRVIVEIHDSPSVSYRGCDVEFFSPSAETVAVMIVKAEDIREIDAVRKMTGEVG